MTPGEVQDLRTKWAQIAWAWTRNRHHAKRLGNAAFARWDADWNPDPKPDYDEDMHVRTLDRMGQGMADIIDEADMVSAVRWAQSVSPIDPEDKP